MVAAMGIVGLVLLKRRQNLLPAGTTTIIAPPLARLQDPSPPPPASPLPDTPPPAPHNLKTAAAPRVPIQLKAEAQSLSRSLMAATLTFKLDIRNLGTQTIRDIAIDADLVTAHGKAPVGQQVANADSELPSLQIIPEIKGQDVYSITGEFRLPVNQIRTISQGAATLFVPLLRVRAVMPGKTSVVQTYVLGILPATGQGKLQPFRLDEMAQTYRNIGLRLLD